MRLCRQEAASRSACGSPSPSATSNVAAGDARPGGPGGDRQVLSVAPGLRRPRQPAIARTTPITAPRGRPWTCCSSAAGPTSSAASAKEFVTGNNDADGVFFPALGAEAFSGAWPRTSRPSWRPGAATRRASTSPTSTISATSTPIPSGGTTTSATSRTGASATSGRTPPTRSWPASRRAHGRSRAAAAPASHFAICGGNTRVRALQLSGDPFAEDPACYLSDDEIGVAPAPRLKLAPYRKHAHAATG